MFCKHKWTVVSETVTKSPIEVIRESGFTNVKNLSNPTDRKHIQIVQCEKCGKLKRFVEKL